MDRFFFFFYAKTNYLPVSNIRFAHVKLIFRLPTFMYGRVFRFFVFQSPSCYLQYFFSYAWTQLQAPNDRQTISTRLLLFKIIGYPYKALHDSYYLLRMCGNRQYIIYGLWDPDVDGFYFLGFFFTRKKSKRVPFSISNVLFSHRYEFFCREYF